MSFKERKARLMNLVYLEHGDPNKNPRKEFDTIIKRLETAEEIRNICAHCVWFKGTTPLSIMPLRVKVGGAPIKVTGSGLPEEYFTPQRFHNEAQKIDRLSEDFKDFFASNYGATFPHKKRLN